MTLQEYLNPKKFPLTTQQGLSPKDQLFLDAYRYDMGQEMLENKEEMTEKGKKIWVELQEKMKYNADLAKRLALQTKKKNK